MVKMMRCSQWKATHTSVCYIMQKTYHYLNYNTIYKSLSSFSSSNVQFAKCQWILCDMFCWSLALTLRNILNASWTIWSKLSWCWNLSSGFLSRMVATTEKSSTTICRYSGCWMWFKRDWTVRAKLSSPDDISAMVGCWGSSLSHRRTPSDVFLRMLNTCQ